MCCVTVLESVWFLVSVVEVSVVRDSVKLREVFVSVAVGGECDTVAVGELRDTESDRLPKCVSEYDPLSVKVRSLELESERSRVLLCVADESIEKEGDDIADEDSVNELDLDADTVTVTSGDSEFVPLDGVTVMGATAVRVKVRDASSETVALSVEVMAGRLSETEREDLDREGSGGGVSVRFLVMVNVSEGTGVTECVDVADGDAAEAVKFCVSVSVRVRDEVPLKEMLLVIEMLAERLGDAEGVNESEAADDKVREMVRDGDADGVLDSVLL